MQISYTGCVEGWVLFFLPAHLLCIKQLFLNALHRMSFSLSPWSAPFSFTTRDVSHSGPADNFVNCLLVRMLHQDFLTITLWSMKTGLVLIKKDLLGSMSIRKHMYGVCICVRESITEWAHGCLIVLLFLCFFAPSFPLSSLLLNKSGHVSCWGP